MPDFPPLRLKCATHPSTLYTTWTEAYYHQEEDHPLGLLALWRIVEVEDE